MKHFSPDAIAKFLGCECIVSECVTGIYPRSLMYEFKAVSTQGTLTLTVYPSHGRCTIDQFDANNNELATASIDCWNLEVREELDEETGKLAQFIIGTGPGGHIVIDRNDTVFSVFYCMYGDRSGLTHDWWAL